MFKVAGGGGGLLHNPLDTALCGHREGEQNAKSPFGYHPGYALLVPVIDSFRMTLFLQPVYTTLFRQPLSLDP